MAAVSGSALSARELGFLSPEDRITMHRDRLLTDAKAFALELVPGYVPPLSRELRLPGASGAQTLLSRAEGLLPLGKLSGHDMTVAATLAVVLTGGISADPIRPIPEEAVLDLEKAGFMELVATAPTRARIAHMLKTGRPLQN